MQVSKINEDGLTHSFSVVLPAQDLDGRVEAKLIELRDQVQLKGFRPGKVPMAHMKRTFGKSVLGEVIEAAVNEASAAAVKDAFLTAATPPKIQITKFEEGGDLEFSMTVDTLPPIPPLDPRELSLERLVAEVSEADVDKAVDRLARSSRELVSKAEGDAAVSGDVVVIDFLGTLDGVAFEGGKGTDFDLELGSGQFIPGFEDQLIGAKAGESRDVNVTFPEGYGAENLAGKAAVFAVTVKDVKEAKATVRDDEFAKKFGFDTYEALREAARGQVAQEYKRASRARIKRSLLDALDKKFDFAVPPSMVEGEIDAIMRQLGGDEEGGTAPQIDDTEKAEFRRIAERRVRLGLLLAEVGRINNVSVAQEDLNRAIVDQARRYPGQERQVFDFYNKNPEAVAELRAPLFEEKVVDFVLELAKVTDRSVSVDELMRDPEAEDA